MTAQISNIQLFGQQTAQRVPSIIPGQQTPAFGVSSPIGRPKLETRPGVSPSGHRSPVVASTTKASKLDLYA